MDRCEGQAVAIQDAAITIAAIQAREVGRVGPRVRHRAGRVPLWIALSIALVVVIWLFDGLSRGVEAAGYESIDPRASHLSAETGFCDPRWDDIMRRSLASLPPVSIHDAAAIEHLRRTVAALPFVAGVGEARVLYPDSVDVPLRLRTPVACVMQGNEFLPVAEDGTLLPGRWPTPPWIETAPHVVGYLPVIGPNDGAFELARAGQRLGEQRHLDALSVALSLRSGLTEADFRVMGPPLIDASRARRDPVLEPGVEIRLEGRRTIAFGRPPLMRALGERPTEAKWADVRRGLEYLRALRATPRANSVRDWSYLDVRWDTSDITWREPEPPRAQQGAGADDAGEERGASRAPQGEGRAEHADSADARGGRGPSAHDHEAAVPHPRHP